MRSRKWLYFDEIRYRFFVSEKSDLLGHFSGKTRFPIFPSRLGRLGTVYFSNVPKPRQFSVQNIKYLVSPETCDFYIFATLILLVLKLKLYLHELLDYRILRRFDQRYASYYQTNKHTYKHMSPTLRASFRLVKKYLFTCNNLFFLKLVMKHAELYNLIYNRRWLQFNLDSQFYRFPILWFDICFFGKDVWMIYCRLQFMKNLFCSWSYFNLARLWQLYVLRTCFGYHWCGIFENMVALF